MNIVINYTNINDNLYIEILQVLTQFQIELGDLTISENIKHDVDNLLIPTNEDISFLKNIKEDVSIKILKNNFYYDILKKRHGELITNTLMLNGIPIDLTKNICLNFKKQHLEVNNFNFYIRESQFYINRLKIFLNILSYYYEFTFTINSKVKILNSLDVQILTPAQSDIYGISITQLIMALQRNRIPASDHIEKCFNPLYLQFEYSVNGIASLLEQSSSDVNLLSILKDNYKLHDFSDLFK